VLLLEAPTGFPRGFDGRTFQELWSFVSDWLREALGISLALPENSSGPYRYISFPLTHTPLRQVDVSRLPDLFDFGRFAPGDRPSLHELDSIVNEWTVGMQRFTQSGARALLDDRRAAVIAQIARELELWDGSVVESGMGRRRAPIEVWLRYSGQRQVDLFFIPRCPPGFPPVLKGEGFEFESDEQGWYTPVRITDENAESLRVGLRLQATDGKREYILSRGPSEIIGMGPAEFSGLLSHRGIKINTRSGVLCIASAANGVSEYLNLIADTSPTRVEGGRLPNGWVLFSNLIAVRRAEEAPPGVQVIEPSSVTIQFVGGLRIGPASTWLSIWPPQLRVEGYSNATSTAMIDGNKLEVEENGVTDIRRYLSGAGRHRITVNGSGRSLQVVNPRINTTVLVSDLALGEAETAWHPLALPPGSWTLIGKSVGEVMHLVSDRANGSLTRVKFVPVWAIRTSPRARSIVAALSSEPLQPSPVKPSRARSANDRWSRIIEIASKSRPEFRRSASAGEFSVPNLWQQYVLIARRLKPRRKTR